MAVQYPTQEDQERRRQGESPLISNMPTTTRADRMQAQMNQAAQVRQPRVRRRADHMQAQMNQPVSGPRGVVTSAGAPSAPKVPGIADGLAGGADMAQPDAVYVEPGSRWGSFAYAGGAVEIGLDDGTTFTRLGSFWIRGGFFQPKSDGTSWDNPALPPSNLEIFSLDGDGIVRVLLNADVPVPLF